MLVISIIIKKGKVKQAALPVLRDPGEHHDFTIHFPVFFFFLSESLVTQWVRMSWCSSSPLLLMWNNCWMHQSRIIRVHFRSTQKKTFPIQRLGSVCVHSVQIIMIKWKHINRADYHLNIWKKNSLFPIRTLCEWCEQRLRSQKLWRPMISARLYLHYVETNDQTGMLWPPEVFRDQGHLHTFMSITW